jgi:hypothetical protein
MKKLINYLIILFTLVIFYSCSNYKTVSFPASEDSVNKLNNMLKNVINENELFLIFTKDFDNSNVKIENNDKLVFEGLITTNDTGKAKVLKVDKNTKITITFKDIKKVLQINEAQMKLYKYIYIEKNKKKFVIEFNNGHKDLGIMPDNE